MAGGVAALSLVFHLSQVGVQYLVARAAGTDPNLADATVMMLTSSGQYGFASRDQLIPRGGGGGSFGDGR